MLTNIARAVVVTAKIVRNELLAPAGNITNKQSMGSVWSHHWHTTMRPKGYERPREMTAGEIVQAQNEKRKEYMNVNEIKVSTPAVQPEYTRQASQPALGQHMKPSM